MHGLRERLLGEAITSTDTSYDAARRVCAADDEVDQMHRHVYERVKLLCRQQPEQAHQEQAECATSPHDVVLPCRDAQVAGEYLPAKK